MHAMTSENTAPKRFLRAHDVGAITGTSAATVWRWSKSNHGFPQPIKLSSGVTVWNEEELFDWIASKRDNVLCQTSPHQGERSA